ncbi:hypothetical protein C8R44DRAFT_865582 [Mycena epipterygia]|nr:hypothetical protein C8R44DRAFT_865582 [Mycena epipterygia]
MPHDITSIATHDTASASEHSPLDSWTDLSPSTAAQRYLEATITSPSLLLAARVAALAPSFPTACDLAVAQAGANTPFNIACLDAAAQGTAAFVSFFHNICGNFAESLQPTACSPCAAQFGVTDPANNAQTNGANANGAAGNGAQAPGAGAPVAVGPRSSTCDINACVAALEPSFPLCAPAVAQLGASEHRNFLS